MTTLLLVEALHQAFRLLLVLLLPPLGAVLGVGLLLEALRLSTKMRDSSIGFIARFAAAGLAVAASGPWIFGQLERFSSTMMTLLTRPA